MHGREASDVLTALREEWTRLGRTSSARDALTRLRAHDGDVVPAWVVDLAGLVAALEPRGGLEPVERAYVVRALLAASDDPVLRRCLLQTLLPGIIAVARALRFGDGVADDPRTFLAEALTEAVELLCDWAGQRRDYAAGDLLAALRCRLRRRLLADKSRRSELVVVPERASGDDGALVRRLAVAAAAGVTDVDLLYARCVLGHGAQELAAATGVSTGILRRRLTAAAREFVATSS
jgi:hypothetical protein